MTLPGSAPQTAEDVFADYLERREAGEDVAFDAVCASHPALADTLRRVHARWQAMTNAFAALSESRGAAATPEDADSVRVRALLDRLAARSDRNTRYALGSELARGAMGRVLRAHDQELLRDVAVKVSRADPADLRQHRRFLEEAQITGQLDHPGIVPIHELGLDAEGRPYFAMRLVQGRDLGRIFALVHSGGEGWTRTRALHVLLRVCEAMAYAHSKGVVHRDLKPGNVMVGQFGETYVMDWGLARVAGRTATAEPGARPAVRADLAGEEHDSPLLTRDGEVVGTPAYMSPEQARGEVAQVDARADVYAVGAMLHHLLVGRMPYVGSGETPTSGQILTRVLAGPPTLVPRRDVPAELCAICERAMARAAGDRYQGMEALAEDLRAFLEVRVVRAYAGGPWAELRKWIQRNRGFATAIACALLLLLAGLLASTSLWQTAEGHRSRADETAGLLRQELDRSEFERARLALRFDDATNAESWLWRQMLAGSHPRSTHWALWELYSRSPCLATLAPLGRAHEVAAFARNYQSVVAGGQDGTLRRLSSEDLRPLAEIGNAGASIMSVTVHEPTGVVATGASDGSISFWSLEPPRALRRVAAHNGTVRALESDPAGILSGGDDGRVLLWRTAEAEPEALYQHPHPVWSIRTSSAGRWLASGDSKGGILLQDRRSQEVIPLAGSWNPVTGLSFAPDESQLWSGGADHQLRVWDPHTRTLLKAMPSRNATCRAIEHLDARTVVVGGWWRIDRWTTDTYERTPLLLSTVWAMDHDAERSLLVAAHSSGVRLFDLSDRGRFELPGESTLMTVSGDGRRVAIYDANRRLLVRALPDGQLVRDLGVTPRYPERMFLDRTGSRLLLARSSPRDRLRVLEVDTGKVLLTTEAPPEPPFRESYALRPDGKEIAVVRGYNVVRRIDVDTRQTIDEWPVDTNEILRVVYSRDGLWLAANGRKRNSVVLCSTRDGALREVAVPLNCSSIALTPDGSRLAAGAWGGEVAIVDVATQKPLARIQTGTGTVWSLVFSAMDPELLICAGGAGPVTFLDLANQRPCLTLDPRSASSASAIALSDDGTVLALDGKEGCTLVDLTYFDRHIAGNLPHQLQRLGETMAIPPERKAELLREAEAVRKRPWPRLTLR